MALATVTLDLGMDSHNWMWSSAGAEELVRYPSSFNIHYLQWELEGSASPSVAQHLAKFEVAVLREFWV